MKHTPIISKKSNSCNVCQSIAIIEQKVELPSKYTETAQQISTYAGGSLEELYAKLKALSVLKPKKLSKEAEDLLEFLECK